MLDSDKIYFPSSAIPVFKKRKGINIHGSIPYTSTISYEYLDSNFKIWSFYFLVKGDTHIEITFDKQFNGLCFGLNNTIQWKVEVFASGILVKDQFDLISVPKSNQKIELQLKHAGVYAFFSIEISPSYLKRCSVIFPLIQQYIGKVENNSSLIHNVSFKATSDMLTLVQYILHDESKDTIKKTYKITKVREMLMLCFMNIETLHGSNRPEIRDKDVLKIQQVKEYLINNVDTDYSLVELAHSVGLNEFKLKKGFKQLFNNTVFGYLLELRMSKAIHILKSTNIPISEIANIVGYKNASNFCAVFKKTFGFTPRALRK